MQFVNHMLLWLPDRRKNVSQSLTMHYGICRDGYDIRGLFVQELNAVR